MCVGDRRDGGNGDGVKGQKGSWLGEGEQNGGLREEKPPPLGQNL
jgi:hypothetical protein